MKNVVSLYRQTKTITNHQPSLSSVKAIIMKRNEIKDFIDLYESNCRYSLPVVRISGYRDSRGSVQFCINIPLSKRFIHVYFDALLDMKDFLDENLICVTNDPVSNCICIY